MSYLKLLHYLASSPFHSLSDNRDRSPGSYHALLTKLFLLCLGVSVDAQTAIYRPQPSQRLSWHEGGQQ